MNSDKVYIGNYVMSQQEYKEFCDSYNNFLDNFYENFFNNQLI